MGVLRRLYRDSLGLVTDLYSLTMAYGYWKLGLASYEAVFNVAYRRNPFGGGYCVACGLTDVIDLLDGFRFEADDVEYLATLLGADGGPLFEPAFLDELRTLRFAGDLDAVEEGTVVFPHEPLVRVKGPIIACQIIEAALLNIVNFQTLIATKAARVCEAAQGDPVLEFGLRRAQGLDGGVTAARAAFVGGCAATSNVLAGKLTGIPVRGTHAHSWVMCFDDELTAFERYAEVMPNNCVFLVDTYDTLQGVRNAIIVGRALRERGRRLLGIRLDSGDLAYLSQKARALLDDAGFEETTIFASSDLDEHIIRSLKEQGATIAAWGVGTRLSTAFDEPALGGVYKLSAVRAPGGAWEPRIKVSEQTVKTSIPGILQVRRFMNEEGAQGDMIYDETIGPGEERLFVDPQDHTRRKSIADDAPFTDLLKPVFRAGDLVHAPSSIQAAQARAQQQLAAFHPGIRRFVYPHLYPVGLEPRLHEQRTRMILSARERSRASADAGVDQDAAAFETLP